MKKKPAPKLNALQQAQLKECLAAGMTPPTNRKPRDLNKGFADMPLFSAPQSKLF